MDANEVMALLGEKALNTFVIEFSDVLQLSLKLRWPEKPLAMGIDRSLEMALWFRGDFARVGRAVILFIFTTLNVRVGIETMFKSVKEWLHAGTHLHSFNDIDDTRLHLALASLLVHITEADHHETRREHRAFSRILREEFDLSQEQVDALHDQVHGLESELADDLDVISQYLKDTPTVRMAFMEKLNRLIDIDGVQSEELDVFYKTLSTVFPDVKP